MKKEKFLKPKAVIVFMHDDNIICCSGPEQRITTNNGLSDITETQETI